jgi:hypothetical protein
MLANLVLAKTSDSVHSTKANIAKLKHGPIPQLRCFILLYVAISFAPALAMPALIL